MDNIHLKNIIKIMPSSRILSIDNVSMLMFKKPVQGSMLSLC